MDTKIIKYLRKLPLFHDLPEEVLAELATQVTVHKLVKNDVLFEEGAPGESVYIIRYGWVKMIIQDDKGNELTLNQFGPSEIIGEIALLDNQPHSASAIALSPVELYELGNQDFQLVIDKHPHLGLLLARNVAKQLRFSITYLHNAVEWSYRIAEGDYSFVMDDLETVQATIIDTRTPDDARARQLLSAFFEMVKGVKKREDALKQKLSAFNINLDEEKKKEDVDALIQKTFFQRIQNVRQRHQPEEDE